MPIDQGSGATRWTGIFRIEGSAGGIQGPHNTSLCCHEHFQVVVCLNPTIIINSSNIKEVSPCSAQDAGQARITCLELVKHGTLAITTHSIHNS